MAKIHDLIGPELMEKLKENGVLDAADPDFDPHPPVKLFLPNSGATWLLAFVYPGNPGMAHGLVDLGVGQPEMGDVPLDELEKVRDPVWSRLPIERDFHFRSKKAISAYAHEAHHTGSIRA